MRFEWDEEKAETNERKHGVTFLEAVTVFDDDLALIIPDPEHSDEENRFIIVGESRQNRLLLVAHAEQEPEMIRIISAREPTRQEKKDYEEG